MRAKEFIIEVDADELQGMIDDSYAEEKTRKEAEIVKIFELIKANCQPYLRAINYDVGKSALYRGSRQQFESSITQLQTKQDRYPKDLPWYAHDAFDEYFLQKFGHRYRSAAAFATNILDVASGYGKAYLFFPIGNFSFCWSPRVDDLFTWMDETAALEQMHKNLSKLGKEDALEMNIGLAKEVADHAKYTDQNLIAATDSGNEVMINCASYYMVNMMALGLTAYDFVGVGQ